jgi:hypothetical protein
LEPVFFDWKDPERDEREGRQIGIIAEQVHEIYPTYAWKNSEGQIEGWHHDKLAIPMLVEMKKLRSRIEALENQLKQNQTAA